MLSYRLIPRTGVLLASVACALASSLVFTGPAQAISGPGGSGYIPAHVIAIKTTNNAADPKGPVGSCINPGSVCVISVASARTTTVATKLGMSAKGVAAELSFSLSRTSSTTVGCTSPKLGPHQRYLAWRLGTKKVYRISMRSASSPGHKSVTYTSGWLTAFQPYAGVHVRCGIQNI